MKSLLPLVLVILLLTGAITYTLSKNTLPKILTKQEPVSPNELEVDSFTTPTPTASPSPKATVTPTPTSTKTLTSKGGATEVKEVIPTITIKKSLSDTEGKIVDSATKKVITTKVTKTSICTPVYGMADTCTEHVVVDTAGEDAIFLNLAGFSYLAGLVAFVKAKNLPA